MRFNYVTIIVTDLERSKAFYRALGLTQLVDAPPRYARFTFPEGDATLSLEVTSEARPVSPPLAQLFFECAAVDETVAQLKSKGVVFEREPEDMFYGWREARLRDPDGHDVRLYKDLADYRLNPPWKMPEPGTPGAG
jgi:hydroxymethylpyrimidine/phosphomethylpyrimidine kinase